MHSVLELFGGLSLLIGESVRRLDPQDAATVVSCRVVCSMKLFGRVAWFFAKEKR